MIEKVNKKTNEGLEKKPSVNIHEGLSFLLPVDLPYFA